MTSTNTKRGFTLIELLVVIAIIGVLLGLIGMGMAKMLDTARIHKCRNNLKQLYTGVENHFMDKGDNAFPYAMSYETYSPVPKTYHEEDRAWVRWVWKSSSYIVLPKTYEKIWPVGATATKSPQEKLMVQGLGVGPLEKLCIENGALFPYMKNDISQYACPIIKRDFGRKTPIVYRTYAMNFFFYSPANNSRIPRRLKLLGVSERTHVDCPPKCSGHGNDCTSCPNTKHNQPHNYDCEAKCTQHTCKSYLPEPAKTLLFAEVEPQNEPDGYQHNKNLKSDRSNDEVATHQLGSCAFNPGYANLTPERDPAS